MARKEKKITELIQMWTTPEMKQMVEEMCEYFQKNRSELLRELIAREYRRMQREQKSIQSPVPGLQG